MRFSKRRSSAESRSQGKFDAASTNTRPWRTSRVRSVLNGVFCSVQYSVLLGTARARELSVLSKSTKPTWPRDLVPSASNPVHLHQHLGLHAATRLVLVRPMAHDRVDLVQKDRRRRHLPCELEPAPSLHRSCKVQNCVMFCTVLRIVEEIILRMYFCRRSSFRTTFLTTPSARFRPY